MKQYHLTKDLPLPYTKTQSVALYSDSHKIPIKMETPKPMIPQPANESPHQHKKTTKN